MSNDALVIGGTGFLGRAVVRELAAAGWNVTCLGRGRQDNPFAGVPLIVADRTRPGELSRVTQGREFSMVVDCAAYQEADVTEAVAAFSGQVGQYILISTDFVYAASPEARYPIPEDAPKQCDLPYAAGKLACEATLIQAWESQRFPALILRPPHILGAGRALGCDPLAMRVPDLLERMRREEELSLLAEGQMLIQPVWSREVGACIVHLAGIDAGERLGGQVFNLAGPDGITTHRYYEIIAGLLGVPLRFRSVSLEDFRRQSPDKAHMARHRLYDLRRLNEVGGYRPQFSVEEAIAETVPWQLEQLH